MIRKVIFFCATKTICVIFELRMVKLTLELMVVVIARLAVLVVALVQVDSVLLVQHDLLPVVEVVLDQHPTNKRKQETKYHDNLTQREKNLLSIQKQCLP